MDASSKCVNASGLPDGIRGDDTPPPFGWRFRLTVSMNIVPALKCAPSHRSSRRRHDVVTDLCHHGETPKRRRKCRPTGGPARGDSDQKEVSLGYPRRHLGTGFSEEHIYLTPHPEPPRQVDPGLHGKADSGHQDAIIRGLEVVEVRPRAMQIPVDGMSGAMHEVRAVSGRGNHAPRGIVQSR